MAERRAALAAEHALARRTEEAIESAQRLFSDKRRAEAIAALEEFVAAEPAAVQAATELERLGRMAARADEEERTLADVLAVVGEAEAALAADNLPDARRLAATAAARLPGHPRVTAVLREAEAVERAAQETLARAACEAIAAARGVFGEHRWDESISQLEAFDHDHPDAPGIDEEIERLRREAVRLAVEERRRAEVDRLCAAARDALEQDHLRVAIDSARRLLQIDPFHEAAARLLTEALRREQLEAEAAAHQLRVAEILGTARLALRQGAWQRAVAECQKALALEPGNDTAETIISLASQRMARVRDALEQARAARRTERRAARRLVIARLAMTVGRSRQAYEAASQALELLPASLQAVKMREAAAAAVGIDTQLADDATVDGPVEMLGSQALGTANSGWHSLLARIAAWTAQWAAVRRSHRG
jgi:tetratricopeptide (TPR) repeat protein